MPGVIVFGNQLANFPLLGATQYTNTVRALGLVLGGAPNAVGEGSWSWAVPIPPSFAGATIYMQAGLADAQGPGGISRTNPLQITFGQ